MTTSIPIPDPAQFFTEDEPATIGTTDPDAGEQYVLADAEEEELAELWAADPGNQGA